MIPVKVCVVNGVVCILQISISWEKLDCMCFFDVSIAMWNRGFVRFYLCENDDLIYFKNLFVL